jgi:hypothetical protein
MLGRDTDPAFQECKSEALSVELACSVKGIKESKILLGKWVFNQQSVGLYCAVLRYIRKIYNMKITEQFRLLDTLVIVIFPRASCYLTITCVALYVCLLIILKRVKK